MGFGNIFEQIKEKVGIGKSIEKKTEGITKYGEKEKIINDLVEKAGGDIQLLRSMGAEIIKEYPEDGDEILRKAEERLKEELQNKPETEISHSERHG